jgi:hypothetical protein
MSKEENNKEIAALLKAAIPPITDSELRRDLWPQMLLKLAEEPSRVPWFDWALAGILSIILLLFPGAIPALLYHL